MEIRIDKSIYNDRCISSVVYKLSGKYTIQRKNDNSSELLLISGYVGNFDVIEKEIWQELNDFKLRGIIENETHDIRTILYAKAFSESDEITEEEIVS